MNKGFVVAIGKSGNLSMRSFHQSRENAIRALRQTIDINPVLVVEANVRFAKNGNVQLWESIKH